MNWLVIAVIVLIVLATLAGAKRGLVKTVLSFASFFVSLVIMLFVREPVSDFVKDQTGIYAAIETSVSSFVEEKTQEIQAGQAQLTDKVIDSLNLPDVLILCVVHLLPMLNLFRIGLALRFQLFQTCPVLLRLLLFLNNLPVLCSDVRPGLRQTPGSAPAALQRPGDRPCGTGAGARNAVRGVG